MNVNKFANFWLNRYNNTNDKGISFMDQLTQKIAIVKNNLKSEYLSDTRPWVVTFSGGKDSTTVLHLVVDMLLEMRNEGVEHSKKSLYCIFRYWGRNAFDRRLCRQ